MSSSMRILAALVSLHLLAFLAMPGRAQAPTAPAGAPEELTGTLRTVFERGRITLGYRTSSLPFSYLSPLNQPIGYSIDLCQEIVERVRDEVGREVEIDWRPVTPDSRIGDVVSGRIDIECGSTTSTAERQREVAFSPVFFIAGTRLLVRQDSPIRSFSDLAGRTLVVTAGTTNGPALIELGKRQGIEFRMVTEPDHVESFARIASGEADGFATDDVLLYGLIATAPNGGDYRVAGDLLSYEPYGLMFRREDPAFADLVNSTFARMAQDGRLREFYTRWFRYRLPTGELLDLPMSTQLAEVFRLLGQPD
jgi:glutamate/aspartate transport system substrate-binding protein